VAAQNYILAIDQGTTSSKTMVVDRNADVIGISKNFPIASSYPDLGRVECDPVELLESVSLSIQDAIHKSKIAINEIAGVSLANQGETIIAFERQSGEPIYPAISWQDRRNQDQLDIWRSKGMESVVRAKTGLTLDPYFSAPKIDWVLKNVPGARELADKGRLCISTSDTWIMYQLLGEKKCVTDLSTASRTMLLNLKTKQWDAELMAAFEIPASVLPELLPNDAIVGQVTRELIGSQPLISGICVDQQAALFGQRCFGKGDVKVTYGTGCFMLGNIGDNPDIRRDGLLTCIGWEAEALTCYALDGGIYTAGTLYKWLIEKLRLAESEAEIEAKISDKEDPGGVFFIPALAGLAAPYWEPEIRGSWHNLSIANDRSDLLRAVAESIAFRVKDIYDAMNLSGLEVHRIRSDGGMTKSSFLMQFQSNLLNVPIEVFEMHEATAFGAALLGGVGLSFWSHRDGIIPPAEGNASIFYPDAEKHKGYVSRYDVWKKILQNRIKSETP
jgi:glycerol kinase